MPRWYLALNAIAYALLAVGSLLMPTRVADFVGFELRPGGLSEFLTVYGGLEAGLAAFFAVGWLRPEWTRAGVLFALCLYAPLALVRIGTLLAGLGAPANFELAACEVPLLLGAIAAWWKVRRAG